MRIFLIAYIMYGLVGCTYETQSSPDLAGIDNSMLKSWSASGKLVRLSTSQAVHISCDFKDSPGAYTVQFNVDATVAQQQASGSVFCQAEIIWSVNGNSIRRLVNVADGVSVSGVGQGVAVYVRDASSGGSASTYGVTLTVAPGTRAAKNQPPYLEVDGIGSLDLPSTGVSVDVPNDAGVISVLTTISPQVAGTAIGAYDVLVRHQSGSGALLKQYDPRQDFFVPISPGATTVTILSSAAAPAIYYKLVWGIDG